MAPRLLAVIAASALAAGGCGDDGESRSSPERPSLRLSSGGLHVDATYRGGADLGPPLAVDDAAVVRGLLDRPARGLDAHVQGVGRDTGRLPVRATGGARRWTLTLPEGLPSRSRLVVSADFGSDGDAVFAAGLRRRAERFQFKRCPRPWRGRPKQARTIAVASLVGLTVKEAERRAATVGCTVRVMERDGEPLPATMDLTNARVNVAVRDGRVTRVLSVA